MTAFPGSRAPTAPCDSRPICVRRGLARCFSFQASPRRKRAVWRMSWASTFITHSCPPKGSRRSSLNASRWDRPSLYFGDCVGQAAAAEQANISVAVLSKQKPADPGAPLALLVPDLARCSVLHSLSQKARANSVSWLSVSDQRHAQQSRPWPGPSISISPSSLRSLLRTSERWSATTAGAARFSLQQ